MKRTIEALAQRNQDYFRIVKEVCDFAGGDIKDDTDGKILYYRPRISEIRIGDVVARRCVIGCYSLEPGGNAPTYSNEGIEIGYAMYDTPHGEAGFDNEIESIISPLGASCKGRRELVRVEHQLDRLSHSAVAMYTAAHIPHLNPDVANRMTLRQPLT